MSVCLRILFVVVFVTESVLALEIRDYDPARHDRFVDFPSNLTENATFYLGDKDWSGFGWSVEDSRKHFTLISPKHFVGARHFRPAVGQRVRFVNRSGLVKTYTVAARFNIENDESPAKASDLFVGELVERVLPEDEVSIVPVYNLAVDSDYANLEFVSSGRDSRAGLGTIATIENFGGASGSLINKTRGLTSKRKVPGTDEDGFFFVTGDSGGPSAVATEDGFALIGTHSSIELVTVLSMSTYTNFDNFVPHYMERLDEVMENNGYHVERFNETVPELSFSMRAPRESVRSSDLAEYQFLITNDEEAEEGHNLRLVLNFSGGARLFSQTGIGWFAEEVSETEVVLVKGGLLPGETSLFSVFLDIPDHPTGAVTFDAELSANGHVGLVESQTTEVIQSYLSWAADLAETGLRDDPDGDGLSNLLEFALGSDGGKMESEDPLALVFEEGELKLSYQQRASVGLYDLEVTVEASPDMENWGSIEATAPVEITPAGYQLQSVSVQPELLGRRFFRLRVDLGENSVF